MLAVEQPALGLMETDWAENRADIPADALRRTLGQFADIFYTTYKRDKFRTRIERGAEAGTVEIYIAHRGMEIGDLLIPLAELLAQGAHLTQRVLQRLPGLLQEGAHGGLIVTSPRLGELTLKEV